MAWVRARRTDTGSERFDACYRDPEGSTRTAGSYSSHRAALRAANREEHRVLNGSWLDPRLGEITFATYVAEVWLPSRHLEATTLAAYRSNLDRHFLPAFGDRRLARILPSTIQDWVTTAVAGGLAPRSVKKYHVLLHSIFDRAVRDRVIAFNPCDGIDLPKVLPRKTRTLTPAEFERLLAAIPAEHQLLISTAIETGMRWGELIGLRPRHIDFLRRTVTVEETIVEVSRKHSPTGERMIVKPYPKDNEPRTFAVRSDWLDAVSRHIAKKSLSRDDLLFATRSGTPISRNTFRTRVWRPAVATAAVDFNVRVHDLRHAHASWLLAGGSDLKSVMERMGHSQIQTVQKYLHTLPEADQKNLDALTRITQSQRTQP